jgi:hypothetical protein
MGEHPVQQPISEIDVFLAGEDLHYFKVGREDVTRIEACEKAGPYSAIPYVRVWAGDTCLAEFCQHQIVGVYFAPETTEAPARATFLPEGVVRWPADHTGKPSCTCTECIPF